MSPGPLGWNDLKLNAHRTKWTNRHFGCLLTFISDRAAVIVHYGVVWKFHLMFLKPSQKQINVLFTTCWTQKGTAVGIGRPGFLVLIPAVRFHDFGYRVMNRMERGEASALGKGIRPCSVCREFQTIRRLTKVSPLFCDHAPSILSKVSDKRPLLPLKCSVGPSS